MWHEIWSDPDGALVILRNDEGKSAKYRLEQDDLSVRVDGATGELEYPPHICPEDATLNHFLADQVLPRLMSHSGSLVLHAACIRHGDGVVLVLGKSGMGKSTLGAFFDSCGDVLLGDDAAVISFGNGEALARPVYPSLRLLPDSFEALLPLETPFADVAHYSDKRKVDRRTLDVDASRAFRVIAMFRIEQPSKSIATERLGTADACMTLVANSFALDPTDQDATRRRLDLAAETARAAPMFSLHYPRNYAKLGALREAIFASLHADQPQ